jgi:hypothetical protein
MQRLPQSKTAIGVSFELNFSKKIQQPMPSKPIHNNTLKTSFAWLCAVVFLMSCLVSSNLYLKHQQVIHRALLQDMDVSALTANAQVNPNSQGRNAPSSLPCSFVHNS